ncbi:MAG: ATP synthase F1 subunit gamma [Acidobacteriota bacterium]|nr:MAG: ATP synthase F1 subunit gamma [Acidobacteriota bacterium]
MPSGNLIDLRRRVRSVKNIHQITRAMKFVSASKLRRAQDRVFSARPYANRMLAVLNSLATRVESSSHPLLAERDGEQIMLIVITSDKGLCGAFNSNVIRGAARYIEKDAVNRELSLTMVGRKGYDWFKSRPWPIKHQYLNIMSRVDYQYAQEIGRTVSQYYAESQLDAVYLVYNEFASVTSQNVVVEPLLPIRRLEPAVENETFLDYIYEQPPAVIFDNLLPKHVETQIFRAMLESEAAEQGARMTAMEAATSNAEEMIDAVTLQINRMRQASITTEIIEIVSGANALQEARSK